jgi:hypothetical protein
MTQKAEAGLGAVLDSDAREKQEGEADDEDALAPHPDERAPTLPEP